MRVLASNVNRADADAAFRKNAPSSWEAVEVASRIPERPFRTVRKTSSGCRARTCVDVELVVVGAAFALPSVFSADDSYHGRPHSTGRENQE